MSSRAAAAAPPEERTTRARIRDAAVACFAHHGVAGTTARKVAAAAGVSPGSVIHHFGSMDGLRTACDEYIVGVIREVKQQTMTAGPGLDVLAATQDADVGPLTAYLAQVLVADSPAVVKLVDDLVADAEQYLEQGVEAGMLRSTSDPRSRAAILTIWSLGALVMHQHLRRILGVDLTDPGITTDPRFAAYVRPVYEILGEGILTEEMVEGIQAAMSEMYPGGGGSDVESPPPTSTVRQRTESEGRT